MWKFSIRRNSFDLPDLLEQIAKTKPLTEIEEEDIILLHPKNQFNNTFYLATGVVITPHGAGSPWVSLSAEKIGIIAFKDQFVKIYDLYLGSVRIMSIPLFVKDVVLAFRFHGYEPERRLQQSIYYSEVYVLNRERANQMLLKKKNDD